MAAEISGTKEHPWPSKTPPGTSNYLMYKDETSNPAAIICVVGNTELRYDMRAIEDLNAMLKAHGEYLLPILGGRR